MRHTLSNGNTGIKGKERALDKQVLQNRWMEIWLMQAGWRRMSSRGHRLPRVNVLFNAHAPMHVVRDGYDVENAQCVVIFWWRKSLNLEKLNTDVEGCTKWLLAVSSLWNQQNPQPQLTSIVPTQRQ